jgi:16S rRNA (uracil1498-N3)-methyltransferase
MARRRFLVDQIRENTAELLGANAYHLARVLRAKPGQQYEISDGAQIYLAEIASVEKERIVFRVLEEIPPPLAPLQLKLLPALIKFDRFEWIVEKATELGVVSILPVSAERSEQGLEEAARKRVARWRRIAHESSQQARRSSPPTILHPITVGLAVELEFGSRYFLDEQPGAQPLLSAIPPPGMRQPSDTVVLLTGPEGGWTDRERDCVVKGGWRPVSLGPLILRAETAALAGAALLMHSWWASRIECMS